MKERSQRRAARDALLDRATTLEESIMSPQNKAFGLSLLLLVLFPQISFALVGGKWVIPQGNGVVVASGGENTLTVCRVARNGTKQPGNLWDGYCYYGLNGKQERSAHYEVL